MEVVLSQLVVRKRMSERRERNALRPHEVRDHCQHDRTGHDTSLGKDSCQEYARETVVQLKAEVLAKVNVSRAFRSFWREWRGSRPSFGALKPCL